MYNLYLLHEKQSRTRSEFVFHIAEMVVIFAIVYRMDIKTVPMFFQFNGHERNFDYKYSKIEYTIPSCATLLFPIVR